MEELFTLKELLLQGNIKGALAIVEELEELSRDDKINAIASYAVILLLHLIKQQAENRTTRSWEVFIRNSVRMIQKKEQTSSRWRLLSLTSRFASCCGRSLPRCN